MGIEYSKAITFFSCLMSGNVMQDIRSELTFIGDWKFLTKKMKSLIYIFIYLKGRDNQGEITHPLVHSLMCSQTTHRSLELHRGLHCGCRSLHAWATFHCSPRCSTRKLDLKQSCENSKKHSNLRCQCHRQWLNVPLSQMRSFEELAKTEFQFHLGPQLFFFFN